MNHLLIAAAIICITIINSGCDPTYDVDYKVINQTEESIQIVVDYNGTPADTNVISSGTTLTFFNKSGIGFTTSDYLDGLDMLPMDLSIFSNTGNPYNKSEEDLSLWQKFYPPRKSENKGMIQLTVRSVDFE